MFLFIRDQGTLVVKPWHSRCNFFQDPPMPTITPSLLPYFLSLFVVTPSNKCWYDFSIIILQNLKVNNQTIPHGHLQVNGCLNCYACMTCLCDSREGEQPRSTSDYWRRLSSEGWWMAVLFMDHFTPSNCISFCSGLPVWTLIDKVEVAQKVI